MPLRAPPGQLERSMDLALLPFTPRFIVYTASIIVLALLVALAWRHPDLLPLLSIPIAVFAGLTLLGTMDLIQTRHAVLRNYPISAHLRFLLEEIRPEMRQYFFEDDKTGTPFSRDTRAVVYQRAKKQLDKRPFGTQYDVYADGYEWLRHSIAPPSVRSTAARRGAASPTTPARVVAALIIAKWAATSSGRSAPVISAAAKPMAVSVPTLSPRSQPPSRSGWSSSS
jgi:hypothetical protein